MTFAVVVVVCALLLCTSWQIEPRDLNRSLLNLTGALCTRSPYFDLRIEERLKEMGRQIWKK